MGTGLRRSATMPVLAIVAGLGACGGDDSQPAPTGTAPPAPEVTRTFDEEYNASTWLVAANTRPAFDAGATGRGGIVAFIDDGIDTDDVEFAGRILVGTPGGSHGNAVAKVGAAAQNGQATMGVAYEANILAYNTVTCTATDCFHSIDEVASAINQAVGSGAQAINVSLVGPLNREPMFTALRNATFQGVIIVIAAGNGGDPNPNGFALDAAERVNSPLIIIAGAHTIEGEPTSITDLAGAGSQWYLSAYSGGATSSSTPVITGAVTLLRAAFPSLSAEEVVQILFESAIDAGDPGVDAIYGNGRLDIGAAYELAAQRAAN